VAVIEMPQVVTQQAPISLMIEEEKVEDEVLHNERDLMFTGSI